MIRKFVELKDSPNNKIEAMMFMEHNDSILGYCTIAEYESIDEAKKYLLALDEEFDSIEYISQSYNKIIKIA